MQGQSKIILGIFLLGIFFVGLSFFLFQNQTSSNLNQTIKLGTIVRETGSLDIIKEGLRVKNKIEHKTDIRNFDSVETSEIGEATVTLENGYQFRTFGNSLLTFEQINEIDQLRILVTIKRGDLRLDKNGRTNELFILKNGVQISADQYNESELKKANFASNITSTPEIRAANTPLSDEEINTTMTHHKNSFYKCYSKLLQKFPAAKGEVTLTFIIENSGRILDLNISGELSDEEFRRCLKDVVGRIEFKPYKGTQISALFPLKFN